jgi:hypothetical protein
MATFCYLGLKISPGVSNKCSSRIVINDKHEAVHIDYPAFNVHMPHSILNIVNLHYQLTTSSCSQLQQEKQTDYRSETIFSSYSRELTTSNLVTVS